MWITLNTLSLIPHSRHTVSQGVLCNHDTPAAGVCQGIIRQLHETADDVHFQRRIVPGGVRIGQKTASGKHTAKV